MQKLPAQDTLLPGGAIKSNQNTKRTRYTDIPNAMNQDLSICVRETEERQTETPAMTFRAWRA